MMDFLCPVDFKSRPDNKFTHPGAYFGKWLDELSAVNRAAA